MRSPFGAMPSGGQQNNLEVAAINLDFETVCDIWHAAGGKNTGGIISWFAPPIVTQWVESQFLASDVANLRFIGAESGGRWAEATGGTNRLGDLRGGSATPGFRWEAAWRLIAIRNPENGESVLIDGNERACELQLAIVAGAIPADAKIRVITGDLHVQVLLIAKAVSSFWR